MKREFTITTIIVLFFNVLFAQSPICTLDNCGEYIGPGGGGWHTKIVTSPHDENVLYAATDMGGVFRSNDKGQTWSYIARTFHGGGISDLAVHPTSEDTIYALMATGMEMSPDQGQTWQLLSAWQEEEATETFPFIGASKKKNECLRTDALVINPHNPDEVFVGFYWSKTNMQNVALSKYYLYKYTASSDTWQALPSDPVFYGPDSSFFNGPIHSVVVDPIDENTLYVAGYYGVYKSSDRGENWTLLDNGLPVEPLPMALTYDQIVTGIPLDTYTGPDIYDLCIHPTNPDTMYVRTRSHGVYKTVNGGQLWEPKNAFYIGELSPYQPGGGYVLNIK